MLFSKKNTIDFLIGVSAVAGISIGAFLGSEIIITISMFEAFTLMYINNDINKKRGK